MSSQQNLLAVEQTSHMVQKSSLEKLKIILDNLFQLDITEPSFGVHNIISYKHKKIVGRQRC
jgi:hypothetical protein